jgi:uncharacterized protein (TIGR03435 family)
MKRILAGASLIVLTSCAVFAQTNAPAFEVASIKQAPPQQMGRMMVRMGGDAGRVDYANVSLKDVLARAYGVASYQISGPAWLDSERYDITAKVPDGVPTDQIPAMLQTLLVDRFKMTVHKESKEEPIYALVVGKGGPKLTKSSETNDAPVMVGLGPDGSKTKSGPDGDKVKMDVGGRGGPGGPGGPGGGPGRGGAMMMQVGGPGGAGKMKINQATMASFSNMLTRLLGRQVTNNTGIEGSYDIELEVSMEELAGMKGGMMRAGPMMAGGGGGGGDHGPAPDAAPAATIFQAVQSLGLKLEAKKGPVDRVIVDKGEKVPTEN